MKGKDLVSVGSTAGQPPWALSTASGFSHKGGTSVFLPLGRGVQRVKGGLCGHSGENGHLSCDDVLI